MAHFALLTPGFAGHLLPLGRLAQELVHRGHRVTIVSRPQAAPLVREMGLPLYEFSDEQPWTGWEKLLWLTFWPAGASYVARLRATLRIRSAALLQRMPQILADLAVDGVMMDQILPAGGSAAERCGLPFVTVCTAPPWNVDASVPPASTGWHYRAGKFARLRNQLGYAGWRWFVRPALREINRYRRQWNLSPYSRIDDVYSPLAQISQLFPEFDFPREAVPPCFHYVGSLAADRPCNTTGFPWERLDGRPLIYASLGTISHPGNRAVYARIAAACAGLDAQLVLARGKWTDHKAGSASPCDFPGDPLVVDYAPQPALLERAALLITHAGLNTTLEGVSRGVPMVALPRMSDQLANAARIVYSGAGLSASFHRGTAQGLRHVIERVLSEEQFRRRARELQQAMRASGGVPRAARIVEQALQTRRPVCWPSSGSCRRHGATPMMSNSSYLPSSPATGES